MLDVGDRKQLFVDRFIVRPIRLHFSMRSAKLYALQFR